MSFATPNTFSADHVTTLKASFTSKTQTTGITANALQHNGAVVSWKVTGAQILRFSKGKFVEYMYFPSASIDGTTSDITFGTATRDVPWDSGTSTTSLSTGVKKWTAGTDIELVWSAQHAAQTPFKDIANTFSAKQTMSVPLGGAVYANSAALPSGSNGDHSAYSTADGVFYDYIAGAWSQRATGTTPNGSTTVAGKFEEATVGEQGSATATGGTGARLVLAAANLVGTSAGAGDQNKIATLNASGVYPINFLATGTPTGSKFVRDDGTLQVPASINYSKIVYIQYADGSTVGASSTALVFSDSTGYTISANDLINGVVYEFDFMATPDCVSGNLTAGAYFGTTAIATVVTAALTNQTGGNIPARYFGKIFGTAAAGASVAVRGIITAVGLNPTVTVNSSASYDWAMTTYTSTSVATNGTLQLRLGATYNASNASHAFIQRTAIITRHATTAS